MSYRVITPPVAEPITYEEALVHLRVIPEELEPADEADIRMKLAAARGMLERRTNRLLMRQTIEFVGHCGGFVVPAAPFAELVSVSYTDAAGTPQVLPNSALYVDSLIVPAAAVPTYGTTLPAMQIGSPLLVRAAVGYADAAAVPAELKMWILLALGALYDNRASVIAGVSAVTLPEEFMSMLWHPYMVYL